MTKRPHGTLVVVRSLALLLAMLSPQLGLSWGMEGHRLIVRVAEVLLRPAARQDIAATLAPGESLVALASWADEVRNLRKETAPWHYVDIPLNSAGFDWERDCPKGNCVIGKIEDFQKAWRDRAVSPAARREALLFLVHFVADLHQPLHCEDNMDRGGNDVPVRFHDEPTNLHALWDTALLKQMPEQEQLFSKLSQAMTWAHVEEWSGGTIADWANESFHIAQQTVYGLLPAEVSGEPRDIGQSYERAAQSVIERQLEKAAARVATILNENAR